MSQALAAAPLKAGINQSKFLSSIKHLFAGHHSVLGELMQNARRAGASGVDFFYDPESSTLTVQDDGRGIDDFAALVTLAQSNWSEETVAAEQPFGMGLFSAFTVADSVTFRSRGKKLHVTLKDIVEARDLHVEVDPDAITHTQVVLSGIDKGLHDPRQGGNTLEAKIRAMSEGFSLPIRLNGAEVPRPFAKAALQGLPTSIGFAHIHGVHTTDAEILIGGPRLFLQGLPISRPFGGYHRCNSVIHLDGSFQARMPDRSHLFDERAADRRITAGLEVAVREHLALQKQELAPEEFVRKHWENCITHGVEELLNDVPYIPTSILSRVQVVSARRGELWSAVSWPGQSTPTVAPVISRAEIERGAVKVWFGVPADTDDHGSAPAILKVAQRERIYCADRMPANHWLRSVCPDASEFCVQLKPSGVQGSATFYSGDVFNEVTITLVDHVDVVLTSRVDPNFRLETRLTDDWVLEATGLEEGVFTPQPDAICYVMAEDAHDHPVDVLSQYEDDDEYREDWRDDALQQWDNVVSALRGTPLAGSVGRALGLAPFGASKFHQGQYAIVGVTPQGISGNPGFQVCGLDTAFWIAMAAALETADQTVPVEQRLRSAFEAETLRQFAGKSV